MKKIAFKFIYLFIFIFVIADIFLFIKEYKNNQRLLKIEDHIVSIDKKLVQLNDSFVNKSSKTLKDTSFKDAFAMMGLKKQLLDIKKEINNLRHSKINSSQGIASQKKLWSDLFSTISSSWVKTYSASLSKYGVSKEDREIAISYYKDMLNNIKEIQQSWLSGEFDSKESFEKVREEGAKFYYNLENDLGSKKASKIVKILYPNISFKDYFLK